MAEYLTAMEIADLALKEYFGLIKEQIIKARHGTTNKDKIAAYSRVYEFVRDSEIKWNNQFKNENKQTRVDIQENSTGETPIENNTQES